MKTETRPQTIINPVDGAEMVNVPAGEFIMGSDDGYHDERPRRTVYVDAYWMYKCPVTVAQYRAFCEKADREMPQSPRWGWIDDHPIVNVTWYDASAYAKWVGGNLPTEAQWEKAARGTDGRIYPWGDEWDKSMCHCGADSTSPVGSYPKGASPYGCLDMAGNVWEWCEDWYDENYYKSAPINNPAGPTDDRGRVLHGGSWYYCGLDNFRAADRFRGNPTDRYDNDGFRVALPINPTGPAEGKERVLRGGSWYSNVPGIFRAANRIRDDPADGFVNCGFRVALPDGLVHNLFGLVHNYRN